VLRIHAEIGAVVLDIHVDFLERSFVEEHFNALARGELALGVLGIDALLAATHPGRRALLFELLQNRQHFHCPVKIASVPFPSFAGERNRKNR
jgi:hypothetical protein